MINAEQLLQQLRESRIREDAERFASLLRKAGGAVLERVDTHYADLINGDDDEA